MSKKRLHPERVFKVLLGVLVPTIWALGLLGYLTGNASFYRWAVIVLSVTLAIAFTPLVAVVVFDGIEKFRGKRRD